MPDLKRKIMLSAVQPSNRLTLGNYLGALKNWVKLQDQYDCLFFAVDLHAITVRQDPKQLREETYRVIATYIAAGINPDHATLFIQSHVPEHAELAWIFNCFLSMGELSRMTQFKDKSAKQQIVSAGLFTYPALMAADILLYQTQLVPVGEDQKQHIELTRDIAIRMNNLTEEAPLFTIPEAYSPEVGARIMSLQDPSSKMSKSDPDPNSSIYLFDTSDQITKKLKRAVTDSGTEITYEDTKAGVKNLIHIQSALLGKQPSEIVASYQGKQYGHLKVETAEIVAQALGPIRDQVNQLIDDRTHLDQILKRGAEKARIRAQKTLERVYDQLGFIPGRY